MHFEMQLRPEGVCAFLLSINLYVLAQFTASCVIERRTVATAVYGVAGAFTAILLGSIRPSFALVAFVALLPLAIFSSRRIGSGKKSWSLAARLPARCCC